MLVKRVWRKIQGLGFRLFAPPEYREARPVFDILTSNYGYALSRQSRLSIRKDGTPLPWYTYPALEYIDQLDFSEKDVFEWGAGNSSLYWSQVARSVSSVEDNREWFNNIKKHNSQHLSIQFALGDAFVNAIGQQSILYDVIVIDGSYRTECARLAPSYLRDGGMVILDNADWYPEAAAILRSADFLEVDMSGFGAVCKFTFTTSLFFHRNFRFHVKSSIQPYPSLGSIPRPDHVT